MKKVFTVFVALISLLIAAASFLPTSQKSLVSDIFVEPTYNSLSGREGSDGEILVAKIDDTVSARPQIGIDRADIVYIEQVEGGLTRLAVVYSSEIPTLIGPIRSARISDIEILAQYGRVVFAYSGAQSKLLPVISSANLNDYGAQRQSPTIYTRDESRTAPTNMVLRADLLLEKVHSDGREIATSRSIGWIFGDLPTGGTAITGAKMSWPAASYDITWSIEEERWLISNNGIPNMSASGSQHGPTTFVIQLVEIFPSEYGDKFGGVTPYSKTVGTGTGFVLRDGKYFPATWSRPDELSGTTWRALDGSELPFARGQVWIALTEKNPQFTLDSVLTKE
jgi:hypothetical protein